MDYSKIIKYQTLLLVISLILSCHTNRDTLPPQTIEMNKTSSKYMTGIIVEHQSRAKNSESASESELYFRASIQDYFIKICESEIEASQLKPFINQPIQVDADILEGYWDDCDEANSDNQSRSGYYMTITEIIN